VGLLVSTAMNKATKNRLALIASAIALSTLSARASETFVFNADINTASLSQEAADAPFDLDFQLLFGNSSLPSNTVTLSNFVFTGGSATGTPVLSGSATGSLLNTVTLTASSAHTDAEFYQQFLSGVTDISFTATVTEAGPDIGTPTEFAASILDNSLGFPAQIYTTAPDTASLITLDLNTDNTLADVQTYAPVSSADGNTSLASVPDQGSTAALLGCAVLGLAYFGRRFGMVRSQSLDTAISA
jgi:hypothetical protein